MLRFRSLGSGSTGNGTLIEARDATRTTRVLVDCGFNLRKLDQRLARIDLRASDIDAVFVTHEHGDHIGCTHALSQREGTAVWMSEGTWLATGAPDYGAQLRLARDGQAIEVGALHLLPFTVPHDAREPLQLRCTDGDRQLGVLTDLGHASAHVMAHLNGLHAVLLECNHDPEMLAASRYPPFLKHRVSGRHGHLSNAAAGEIAQAIHHSGLRHVLAAHLSQQNNRPDLARAALAMGLGAHERDMLTADAVEGSDWLQV